MKAAKTSKSPKVLVVDVGGTNVKMLATGQKEPRKGAPFILRRVIGHL
jgi:hypothetical protein